MKEEQILFPYIVRMEESVLAEELAPPAIFGTGMNPVRIMMQEHDGAGGALRSLHTITNDYKVPDDACISYRTLYQALQGFETDLHQHIQLENNFLFPRAVALVLRNSRRAARFLAKSSPPLDPWYGPGGGVRCLILM